MPSTAPSQSTFAQHVATFIVFGSFGTTLFTRQPALQAEFQLSASDWGWCLLALGAGGVSAYPLTRWMLLRHGSRVLMAVFGGLLGTALALLPWWPGGLPTLLVALFCQGLLGSGVNVAINNQAACFEARTGRFCMGRLHALFFIGVTAGALIGSAAVAADLSARQHFGVVGLGIACAFVWLSRGLDTDRMAPPPAGGGWHRPSGAVVGLGVLGCCAAMVDSGINGWAPLFLHEVVGASPSVASLGLAAYCAAMFVGRMLTDANIDRFGPRRLVRMGALLSGVSLLALLLMPSVPMALLVLVLVGLGQAAVFPILFSAAGRLGGASISGVATLSSTGALLGPALLGRVAAVASTHAVFAGIAAAVLLLGWRAGVLPTQAARPQPGTKPIGA